MATIRVDLVSPSGVATDITTRLDPGGTLEQSIEEDSNQFVPGDFEVTARNRDGWFTTQFASINPELWFDEVSQTGCWRIRIYKAGALQWEGDVDPQSIDRDAKVGTCSFSALGILSRLQRHNAALVKRPTTLTNPVSVTGTTKGKRLVTLPDTVANANLRAGDKWRFSGLSYNNGLVQQELETLYLGPDPAHGLGASDIKVKGLLQKAYTEGVLLPLWHRGETLDTVVSALFEHCGYTSGQYEINSVNSSAIVDVADFEDKTVLEALQELAAGYGCMIVPLPGPKFLFQDRETNKTGDSPYSIEAAVRTEDTTSEVFERYYTTVVVRGTGDRYYRAGKLSYPKNELEVTVDFTGDPNILEALAKALFALWGKKRRVRVVGIKDSGHRFNLWDRVTLGSEDWWITGLSEPVRSLGNITVGGSEVAVRGGLALTLLQVNGTAPSAADEDPHDDNLDRDPPFPPHSLEIGKATDAVGGRPSWWADFRAKYHAKQFPIRKKTPETDDNGDTVWIKRRLWCIRAKYDGDAPDGFLATFYKATHDPGSPTGQRGFDGITPDSGGWYHFPMYKRVDEAVAKCAVLQTFDQVAGLSAYSDPVSTDDVTDSNGDGGLDAPVVTGCALASPEHDITGTPGKECDLDATVSWTGTCTDLVVEVTAGSNVHHIRRSVAGLSSPQTVHCNRRFKRGQTLTVKARGKNLDSPSAWYDAGTVTAGASALPDAPVLTSGDCVLDETKRRQNLYHVNLPATWGSTGVRAHLRRLKVFKRTYSGSPGTPDTDPANWKLVRHIFLADEDGSGNLACGRADVHFAIPHTDGIYIHAAFQLVDAWHQKSAWVVLAGATPADSDDAIPAVPSATAYSYEQDVAATDRIECDFSLVLSGISGADRLVVKVHDSSEGADKYHYFKVETDGVSAIEWKAPRKFTRGVTISYLVRAVKGTAKSAWSTVATKTAGADTGTQPSAPAAPTVTVVKKRSRLTKYKADWSGHSQKAKYRRLEVYIADKGTTSPSTPTDSDSTWQLHQTLSLKGAATRGYLHFNVAHQEDDIPEVSCRLLDSYGRPDTLSGSTWWTTVGGSQDDPGDKDLGTGKSAWRCSHGTLEILNAGEMTLRSTTLPSSKTFGAFLDLPLHRKKIRIDLEWAGTKKTSNSPETWVGGAWDNATFAVLQEDAGGVAWNGKPGYLFEIMSSTYGNETEYSNPTVADYLRIKYRDGAGNEAVLGTKYFPKSNHSSGAPRLTLPTAFGQAIHATIEITDRKVVFTVGGFRCRIEAVHSTSRVEGWKFHVFSTGGWYRALRFQSLTVWNNGEYYNTLLQENALSTMTTPSGHQSLAEAQVEIDGSFETLGNFYERRDSVTMLRASRLFGDGVNANVKTFTTTAGIDSVLPSNLSFGDQGTMILAINTDTGAKWFCVLARNSANNLRWWKFAADATEQAGTTTTTRKPGEAGAGGTCFPAGTYLKVKSGKSVLIEDLVVGQTLAGVDPERGNEVEDSAVLDVVEYEAPEYYALGVCPATAEHLVFECNEDDDGVPIPPNRATLHSVARFPLGNKAYLTTKGSSLTPPSGGILSTRTLVNEGAPYRVFHVTTSTGNLFVSSDDTNFILCHNGKSLEP